MNAGIMYALLAAVLFGASTPFAKTLVGQIQPVMLAGLLYLGSGIGLLCWLVIRGVFGTRNTGEQDAGLTRSDFPWLAGAILAGGVLGPVLLMLGLAHTQGSTASLLLNMEGVFTALLAWFVFRENFDRRIFLGMMLIIVASMLLSWDRALELGGAWGALAIMGACLCWAIDNNLTRRVSASDATQIAGLKGLAAGSVNLAIALLFGARWPGWDPAVRAALIGLTGYGISLVLFVLALRHLGTARTGAYFSVAPFVGAAIALMMLKEVPGLLFWPAAALMGTGIWLHLTERHVHEHTHEAVRHTHRHVHDEHHRHAHNFSWNGAEPHTHEHAHAPLTHRHPHYPDVHHRHNH